MSLSWSTVSCKQVWRLSVAGKSAFGWSDLPFRVKPRAIKHQALVINDNPEFLMAHDSNRPGLKPSIWSKSCIISLCPMEYIVSTPLNSSEICSILIHFVSALQIYDRYKADDGFLYIAYSAENTLGWETGTVDLWLCRLTSRWRWPNRRHVQKTLGVLGTSPTLLDFKHIHENILDVQWSTGIIQNRKLPYWR